MDALFASSQPLGIAEILILAILQGVAEFLPISSSGHVVVASSLLGQNLDVVEINIVLHAGTLLSIGVFYFRDILRLFKGNAHVIPKIVVATIPAVVVGLTVKRQFPELLNDVLLTGFMFVVTGFLLLTLAKLFEEKDSLAEKEKQADDSEKSASSVSQSKRRLRPRNYVEMNWYQAIVIGAFQAVAILPGISRSGSTIVAGCLVGLNRNSAATFSFLLALPVISGATVLEAYDIFKEGGTSSNPGLLVLGFFVAFVVGLLSLSLLVRWLGQGRLHLFAYYVIPLGFAVVVWQILLEVGVLER